MRTERISVNAHTAIIKTDRVKLKKYAEFEVATSFVIFKVSINVIRFYKVTFYPCQKCTVAAAKIVSPFC